MDTARTLIFTLISAFFLAACSGGEKKQKEALQTELTDTKATQQRLAIELEKTKRALNDQSLERVQQQKKIKDQEDVIQQQQRQIDELKRRWAQIGASIQRVESQAQQAILEREKAGGLDEKLWDSRPYDSKLIENLQRIDTAQCPKDYQIAFQNYINAYKQFYDIKAWSQGVGAVLTGIVDYLSVGINFVSRYHKVEAALKRRADCEAQLKLLKTKYQ